MAGNISMDVLFSLSTSINSRNKRVNVTLLSFLASFLPSLPSFFRLSPHSFRRHEVRLAHQVLCTKNPKCSPNSFLVFREGDLGITGTQPAAVKAFSCWHCFWGPGPRLGPGRVENRQVQLPPPRTMALSGSGSGHSSSYSQMESSRRP